MTAMLACDGCGNIVSDRPDDDDPTFDWWCLTSGPIIGGNGLLPMISITESIDEDETPTPPPTEPQRHFCSIACLGAWVEHRNGVRP